MSLSTLFFWGFSPKHALLVEWWINSSYLAKRSILGLSHEHDYHFLWYLKMLVARSWDHVPTCHDQCQLPCRSQWYRDMIRIFLKKIMCQQVLTFHHLCARWQLAKQLDVQGVFQKFRGWKKGKWFSPHCSHTSFNIPKELAIGILISFKCWHSMHGLWMFQSNWGPSLNLLIDQRLIENHIKQP